MIKQIIPWTGTLINVLFCEAIIFGSAKQSEDGQTNRVPYTPWRIEL